MDTSFNPTGVNLARAPFPPADDSIAYLVGGKVDSGKQAARPIGYEEYNPIASSYASRTMLMSGIIIFVFIVYHLLHFTVQCSISI